MLEPTLKMLLNSRRCRSQEEQVRLGRKIEKQKLHNIEMEKNRICLTLLSESDAYLDSRIIQGALEFILPDDKKTC